MEFCADDAELAELSASPPALADDSDTNRRSLPLADSLAVGKLLALDGVS